MSIKLVTFDLDDTLWNNCLVIQRSEKVLREWLIANILDLNLEEISFNEIKKKVLTKSPSLQHRMGILRYQILLEMFRYLGYKNPEYLANKAFEVFTRERNKVVLFSESIPTLEALSEKYSLAVITNGNANLRIIGIEKYFSFILTSETLGIAKPDPNIFYEALSIAKVAPNSAVHIGDNPINDIIGAASVGMKSIWFNPQLFSWNYTNCKPYAEVSSLDMIPSLLK